MRTYSSRRLSFTLGSVFTLGAAAVTVALPADAATCSADPYTGYRVGYDGHIADYGDMQDADYYFTDRICDTAWTGLNPFGTRYYRAYGMEKDVWDGFGWNTVCDWREGMPRALGAFYLLERSDHDAPGNLYDVYKYVDRNYRDLEDLRAHCGSGGDRMAETQANWGADNYTDLFVGFFYRLHIVARGATLYHEARHYTTDLDHSCGETKDQNWYAHGTTLSVYASNAAWAISYYKNAVSYTNSTWKTWARYYARMTMDTKFCNPSSIPAAVRGFDAPPKPRR